MEEGRDLEVFCICLQISDLEILTDLQTQRALSNSRLAGAGFAHTTMCPSLKDEESSHYTLRDARGSTYRKRQWCSEIIVSAMEGITGAWATRLVIPYP